MRILTFSNVELFGWKTLLQGVVIIYGFDVCVFRVFFLLVLLPLSCSAITWLERVEFNVGLEHVIAGQSGFVAYGGSRVASSSDGITWSDPVLVDFNLLDISSAEEGGFLAVGYTSEPNLDDVLVKNRSIVSIYESTDGLDWSVVHQFENGFSWDLPVQAEVLQAEGVTLLSIWTTPSYGTWTPAPPQAVDLVRLVDDAWTSVDVQLNRLHYSNGVFYGSETRTSFGDLFDDHQGVWKSDDGQAWEEILPNDQLVGLDGNIVLGTSSSRRIEGEVEYSNSSNYELNALEAFYGVGGGYAIQYADESFNPKNARILVSDDFRKTWKRVALPGAVDLLTAGGAYHDGRWVILASRISGNQSLTKIYSGDTPNPKITSLGAAPLQVTRITDGEFFIVNDNLIGIEPNGLRLTFPDNSTGLFQVYTSRDLMKWSPYGRPFPGGTTHEFPIGASFRDTGAIYFRAEQVLVSEAE